MTSLRLRGWLRQRRELCPPLLPVSVRRVPALRVGGRESCGGTSLLYDADTDRPLRFVIVLERRMSVQETFGIFGLSCG